MGAMIGVGLVVGGGRGDRPPPIRIVLLGDSTVETRYLPKGQRLDVRLGVTLRTAYPGQAIQVANLAQAGEDIAGLLESGRYGRLRSRLDGIDIIFVRYGQNDAKRVTPERFYRHLGLLVDLLEADYPGIHVLLETGLYFDPSHMALPRNPRLIPYWNQTRRLARERGLALSHVYQAMARETAEGHWDLRVRSAPNGRVLVDGRQDGGHGGDLAWYSNGHPNAEGTRVACDEQLRVLQQRFPSRLPEGGRRARRLSPWGERLHAPSSE